MSNKVEELTNGWEMAPASELFVSPSEASGLGYIATRAPCTVASTLRQHKQWHLGSGARFDTSDYWFRCRFTTQPAAPQEQVLIRFQGIATVSEVWLNGQAILKSGSMFASQEVDVTGIVQAANELVIVCRSLTSAMKEKRRHAPAARWRTRVVAEQQLRWFRTTMLGRAPGFAPEPEPVGPWRPVSLIRRSIMVEDFHCRAHLEGDCGVVDVRFSGLAQSGTLCVGEHSTPFVWDGSKAYATLRIPSVTKWWPHTHGSPALYPLRVTVMLENGEVLVVEDSQVGFRTIESVGEGLALRVNGTPVFCRGVAWMPPDVVSLASAPAEVRQRLELLRDGAFNMIRIAGTTIYQDHCFHAQCDKLGLLVWQDMMFANMDYPFADEAFHGLATTEATSELSRLSRHPSTAMLCGNSEIEQQAAMFGLEPAAGRGEFFIHSLPAIAAQICPGVPYIPSAPYGGDLPFRTNSGVANYFGVGAYLRPLEDARRAEVRFASECLAFANVPEPEMVEQMAAASPGGISPTHPAWKRGVPRDGGAGWDFEDVRDHYLKSLYSVDPAHVRYADAHRYWELSRMVSGEVMAAVFGEWRRPKSPCGGGIILWSTDLEPGAGWGILDSTGRPKAAYWFLKRVLAPCSIWTTDEGLNGIDIHIANDGPTPLAANLRTALYRNGEKKIEERQTPLVVPAHEAMTIGVERVLGRFADVSYAYRFGAPSHDLVVASLYRQDENIPFAQAFHFPLGLSSQRIPVKELGIMGRFVTMEGGRVEVALTARKLVYGLRLSGANSRTWGDDSYFNLEPEIPRRILLRPDEYAALQGQLVITAINAEGRLLLKTEGQP